MKILSRLCAYACSIVAFYIVHVFCTETRKVYPLIFLLPGHLEPGHVTERGYTRSSTSHDAKEGAQVFKTLIII